MRPWLWDALAVCFGGVVGWCSAKWLPWPLNLAVAIVVTAPMGPASVWLYDRLWPDPPT